MRCMLLIKLVKSGVGLFLLFSLDSISHGEWVLFTVLFDFDLHGYVPN
jgi:hypothetical protein